MKLTNTSNLPTEQLRPLIHFVLSWVDEAARSAKIDITPANHNSMGGRALFRSVLLKIGRNLRPYPQSQTYKKRAGRITYADWKEHFIVLLAHELRHVDQFALRRARVANGSSNLPTSFSGSQEVDAENFAKFVLKKWREQGSGVVGVVAQHHTGSKTCPKCGQNGDIEGLFGYRHIGPKKIPQSYCRECRKLKASAGTPQHENGLSAARTPGKR